MGTEAQVAPGLLPAVARKRNLPRAAMVRAEDLRRLAREQDSAKALAVPAVR